jgi:hypothetical protein
MREFMNRAISSQINIVKPTMDYLTESYILGEVEETVYRIGKKLEVLCSELKSLNTILENNHER